MSAAGSQRQRTELAWLRMTLSSWAMAVLTARTTFPAGLIVVAGPAALTAIAHARRRRLGEDAAPAALRRETAMLLAVACAALVAAAALAGRV
ncbi:hypothetical protein [Actinomadura sp. DC4]|uniref:hypothetical protein n=1 Tax=Actinomadura sp. DC4 TaxID=3055069 RepID=UPI0025B1D7AC|nr:hypothetical protein [Actinomadura sp. DC4]MDN3356960.1 hypothetical protein [Actinomadura sp. DC4]